jgi:hypothetical protein
MTMCAYCPTRRSRRDSADLFRARLLVASLRATTLVEGVLTDVRRFYAGHFDPEAHMPYYRPSSRV